MQNEALNFHTFRNLLNNETQSEKLRVDLAHLHMYKHVKKANLLHTYMHVSII